MRNFAAVIITVLFVGFLVCVEIIRKIRGTNKKLKDFNDNLKNLVREQEHELVIRREERSNAQAKVDSIDRSSDRARFDSITRGLSDNKHGSGAADDRDS